IDTARFLLGDPAPEAVCARIGTRYGSYAVDDDGVLLIGWSNGTTSTVESGWWHPRKGGLEAETELYGTGGYARIWDFTEEPEGYEHCAQPMYSAQVAEFIDAIGEGRQPRPSGEDGAVVVVAGTGTVAAGRNREGRTARTLGLGRVLGDEGSASDVSEAALRAVARAYTGRGPATSLSEGLCQVRGASSVVQLLEEYSRGGEPEFNAAPLVLAHAARGDAVAAGIVEWAGSELGAAAATVARTL